MGGKSGNISLIFYPLQHGKINFHIVGFRPYAVRIVIVPGAFGKGNFVFVIIVFEIGTQPDKTGRLSVFDGFVLFQFFDVNEHAYFLIGAHIQLEIAKNGSRFPILEIFYSQYLRLFV